MENPSDHHEHESHLSKFITQVNLHCTQNFDEEVKHPDTMGLFKNDEQTKA